MSDGLLIALGGVLGLVLGILIGAFVDAYRNRRASRQRRRERAASIEQSRASVQEVLNAIPQSHIVLDPDDSILHSSSLAYAFGIVRNGALRDDVAELVENVRSEGGHSDAEIRLPRLGMDDATDRRVWIRAALTTGGNVLVLFEDNTEKRRLEETRRDFVANVSHELKTPVGAVGLLAETLKEVADEPEHVRKFSEKLVVESNRLASLVQEIIQLSLLQDADSLRDPKLVDVDEVIAEALDRMQIEANARDVTLVSGGTKNLKVYGDKALLTTAVRNLLDNAVRYSRPYSRVSVGVSHVDEEVEIAVVDEGEGISDSERERIFERFYRGDKARSRETGGSGLGLSIVKHVVADHGGRIKLWSELGKGSTFTMILPEAYAPRLEAVPDTSGEQSAPAGGSRGTRTARSTQLPSEGNNLIQEKR